MMWMPKPSPMAWILSASGLKPLLPVADGYLLVAGRGRPVAEKVSGAVPVAGIGNSKGMDGLTPTMNGACRRGVAGGAVIEMAMVVWARAAPPRQMPTAITSAAARDRKATAPDRKATA